MPDDIPLIC